MDFVSQSINVATHDIISRLKIDVLLIEKRMESFHPVLHIIAMCLYANFSPLVLAKLILPKIMLRISLPLSSSQDSFSKFSLTHLTKVSSVFDVRISFVLVGPSRANWAARWSVSESGSENWNLEQNACQDSMASVARGNSLSSLN
jgi:hypothetical protein